MAQRLIRTSFDIVTEESAAEGDAAEHGWLDEEGTEFTVEEAIEKLEFCEPSASQFHPGVWYTQKEGDTDYQTGEVTTESYHLVGFTEAEQREIFEAVQS